MASSTNSHAQQAMEENRSALLLFAIVILFFVCQLPRNFLNIHEALTFSQKKEDYLKGCDGMPLWILIIGLLSHLLLTCNSAFNFLLYCAMSKLFRVELKAWLAHQQQKFCNLAICFNNAEMSPQHQNPNFTETIELTTMRRSPSEWMKQCYLNACDISDFRVYKSILTSDLCMLIIKHT